MGRTRGRHAFVATNDVRFSMALFPPFRGQTTRPLANVEGAVPEGRARPDWLSRVSSPPLKVVSGVRHRTQGAAGALARADTRTTMNVSTQAC